MGKIGKTDHLNRPEIRHLKRQTAFIDRAPRTRLGSLQRSPEN